MPFAVCRADPERFTSANSISVGRLLPQCVYPFFAYARVADYDEPMIASVPSGNFGDMMGTVLAREMGLPIEKIICGVNENDEFPEFLKNETTKSLYLILSRLGCTQTLGTRTCYSTT